MQLSLWDVAFTVMNLIILLLLLGGLVLAIVFGIKLLKKNAKQQQPKNHEDVNK